MALMIGLVVFTAFLPFTASQTTGSLQPGFGPAIEAVHKAESAGATPNEVSPLAAQLNKALELNREALRMSTPDESGKRAELLAQVDQNLTAVKNEADQLAVASAQREYIDKILTYVGGAIAAILGLLIYCITVSFYAKYRVKRTFQMRIRRK
jgi:hypothetical protein